MSIQDLTDEELFERAQAGEEEAFTCLYRRRQAGLYRFALRMSGSAVIAEDVTQEVFLALLRDGTVHPEAWFGGGVLARHQSKPGLAPPGTDGPQAAETASGRAGERGKGTAGRVGAGRKHPGDPQRGAGDCRRITGK